MGYGRHTYREAALVEHKGQVAAQTQVYQSMLNITRWRASQGLGVAGEDENMPLGQKIFKRVCSTCHALDKRLVGPPLTEIVDIYGDDTAGIIKWVKAPGKKRPDFPEMPAIKLTEEQYNAVAQYLLDAVAAAGESQESDSEPEAEAETEAAGQP